MFARREYRNVIDYIPKDAIMVQDDCRTFKIGVKPKDGASEIKVAWEVLSRDYSKQGTLLINVIPSYEEKHNVVIVYNKSELKEAITEIIPKIIKE